MVLCPPHLHLFAGEDESLLLRRNALLLLDALLDAVHFVGGLNVDLDLLAGERLRADKVQCG